MVLYKSRIIIIIIIIIMSCSQSAYKLQSAEI